MHQLSPFNLLMIVSYSGIINNKDPLRIELKDLITQSLSDTIAVATSSFFTHLPIKDHILSRKTVRLELVVDDNHLFPLASKT